MGRNLCQKRFASPVWLAIAIAIVLAPVAAQAYVGPGAGLSLLGALWGVLCAIGAAFLFVIMWPIRRLRRRRREAKRAETAPQHEAKSEQQRSSERSASADRHTPGS